LKNLSEKISDLLFEYDCVIIPELGGFVTNYKPAYINEDTQVIFPPSKALSFNGNLTNNDGLLANHISVSENITFEEANAQLKNEVENCFEKLNAGNRVVFEKVGILYLDEESSVQFEPYDSINYLSSSFGMYEFHCPVAALEKVEEAVVEELEPKVLTIPENKVIEPSQTEKIAETPVIQMDGRQDDVKKPGKFRYWAAAVILPLIMYAGLVTYNSDVLNDRSIHISDLNPLKSFEKNNYSERTVETRLEDAEELIINIDLEKKEKIEEAETRETAEIPKTPKVKSIYADEAISNYPFHIINGCFSIQKNAEKHTKRLRKKGFDAYIVDKKGRLYRVSQGSFQNEEEALALLRQLKNGSAPEAWILKK